MKTMTWKGGTAAREARRPVRTLVTVATAVVALGGTAACDPGGGAPDGASGADGAGGATTGDVTSERREIVSLEVAALPDSAAAARVRDSLDAAGWPVALVRRVRAAAGDTLPPWRVRVAPAGGAELAQISGIRLAAQLPRVVGARDSVARLGPTVIVRPVNTGGRGAISRLRWAMSPDRQTVLAVESTTAVENEPSPDGFVIATERGPLVVQRDSVWDVAPDPRWERVAYGRAFLIPVGGRDSVSIRRWGVVAGRTNLDVSVIQRGAFRASSMNEVAGFAQPAVEALHPDSTNASQLMWQVTAPIPTSGGWRVKWSADGRTLAVGLPPGDMRSPRVPRDDTPAAQWLAVDLHSHLVRGALPSHMALDEVRWMDGPMFDVSVDPPTGGPPIPVAGGRVETTNGWVVLRGQRSAGRPFVVGPGVALAATASGRFVLAVVPVMAPTRDAPQLRPVLYQIEGSDETSAPEGE